MAVVVIKLSSSSSEGGRENASSFEAHIFCLVVTVITAINSQYAVLSWQPCHSRRLESSLFAQGRRGSFGFRSISPVPSSKTLVFRSYVRTPHQESSRRQKKTDRPVMYSKVVRWYHNCTPRPGWQCDESRGLGRWQMR